MTILHKTVSLNPSESKEATFTFTPGEVRAYQVLVNGLTGSFTAIAPVLEPSTLLIELQYVLSEAYIAVNAGYPEDWVMVPGYGLTTAEAAIPMVKQMMIDEATRIGYVNLYFVNSHLYTNGELIV